MEPSDLEFQNLQENILAEYKERAPTVSAQFLRWFLEGIFRLDQQEADDACVDSQQDKGIDGIYVSDATETIYFLQSRVRQKSTKKLGDKDLKEFIGSVGQFDTKEGVEELLKSNASGKLKNCIKRQNLAAKVDAGYFLKGVFCTNLQSNEDAILFSDNNLQLELYDSERISYELVDISSSSGVEGDFTFDTSDSDVIEYSSKDAVETRIFLASGSDLANLDGISDGKLFERNVRLSLGNTKINKGLKKSISNKLEHQHFPLYHNGINIICTDFDEDDDSITISNYVVVNGAQSITSLFDSKNYITDELKILTKIVAVKNNESLADRITYNSNNQNAIKARDLRSNHPIQARLKKEIEDIGYYDYVYQVKRGEDPDGSTVISNEDAGLILAAMDLGEPWTCHQRYRVMDDSHSRIFGRPEVTGYKVLAFFEAFHAAKLGLENIDDKSFASYNLTKFFLAHVVAEIVRSSDIGKAILINPSYLFDDEFENVEKFETLFTDLSQTVALDLNAEIEDLKDDEAFDYKAQLKSAKWCKAMQHKLLAAYQKDVQRKKADPIDDLLDFIEVE